MNKKDFLYSYLNMANIIAARLNSAVEKVQKFMPMTVNEFANMQDEQIAFLDMMTMRFGKLQDIIGAKIFPLILEIIGEEALTFIDKLNKLEKFGYISDANWWMQLREVRNRIAHDYPDDYQLLYDHTTIILRQARELLRFWAELKSKLELL